MSAPSRLNTTLSCTSPLFVKWVPHHTKQQLAPTPQGNLCWKYERERECAFECKREREGGMHKLVCVYMNPAAASPIYTFVDRFRPLLFHFTSPHNNVRPYKVWSWYDLTKPRRILFSIHFSSNLKLKSDGSIVQIWSVAKLNQRLKNYEPIKYLRMIKILRMSFIITK